MPLQVVIGATCTTRAPRARRPRPVAAGAQGVQAGQHVAAGPGAHARGLRAGCARDGATAVVSIHLSGDMSGTFESAQLAAEDASIPVFAVDSRQVGVATGFAALTAADVLDAGGTRRGGGEGRAGAGRGVAVAVLRRHPGVPAPRRPDRRRGRAVRRRAVGEAAAADRGRQGRHLEKVRTSARALSRLEELAVEAAGEAEVDVCVAHLASPDRAGAAGREPGDHGSRTTSAGARCGAASWARCWARTWARACSRSASRRAPDRKPHLRGPTALSVERVVLHRRRATGLSRVGGAA